MRDAEDLFFARALKAIGLPRQIIIDKSGANTAGITAINHMPRQFGCPIQIEMARSKYLNSMAEQDHRFIRLMLGFKAFASAAAAAALACVEANMIRKGQFAGAKLTAFEQLAQLAA